MSKNEIDVISAPMMMQLPRRIVLDEIDISGRQEFLEFLVQPLQNEGRDSLPGDPPPCTHQYLYRYRIRKYLKASIVR